MIPPMPGLIPASRPTHPPHPPQHPPQSPQHPPQSHHQPPLQTIHSDDQLQQSLDDQIQFVKQIQKILGTEQIKLEFMTKDLHARNLNMEKPIQCNLARPSENPKSRSESIRIRSPSSVNEKPSIDSNNVRDAIEIEKVDIKPVEKPGARTYCVVRIEEQSNSEERKQLERFRTFWSGCDYSLDDDDGIDELDCVNIKQLVEEEMKNTILQ